MTGFKIETLEPEVKGDQIQTAGKDKGQEPSKAATAPSAAPSWFDEATKFYSGKKTSLNAEDEVGQEMWKSIQSGNKLKEESDSYKKQLDEVMPYKTDLEWVMSNPSLAAQVKAILEGTATAGGNYGKDEELTDEEKRGKATESRLAGLEQLMVANLDRTIGSNFDVHLKELQEKYPSMDVDTVRRLAISEKMIYNPKAKEKVEELAKKNHEFVEGLKQKVTDETYANLREKGKKSPPSTAPGATKTNAETFGDAFENAWAER